MECPRCQHQNRPRAKFCAECAGPPEGASAVTRSHADDLKAQLDTLKPSLTKALEQQPPRPRFLRVTPTRRSDVQPVCEPAHE